MKFTLSWLKDHLDTDATLEEMCARLSAIGSFSTSLCICPTSIGPR